MVIFSKCSFGRSWLLPSSVKVNHYGAPSAFFDCRQNLKLKPNFVAIAEVISFIQCLQLPPKIKGIAGYLIRSRCLPGSAIYHAKLYC